MNGTYLRTVLPGVEHQSQIKLEHTLHGLLLRLCFQDLKIKYVFNENINLDDVLVLERLLSVRKIAGFNPSQFT